MAPIPFARERVALLFVPNAPPGARNVGSGYFIDDRRVLTAAHVVGDRGTRCKVRPLGHAESLWAEVAWRGAGQDAALLELRDDQGPGGAWAPVSYGAIQRGGLGRIPCGAVGFPDAQVRRHAEGYQVRGTEGIEGQIEPQTGDSTQELTVHLEGSVPKETGAESTPWAGISGAALFAGPVLVGVLAVSPGAFGADRLLATAIGAVATDPGFVAALGLTAPPDLLPVSAPVAERPPAGPGEPSTEAPLVSLPFARNPAFAGRQTLLATLGGAPAGQAQALVGMGGVGKSQLAIECAYGLLEQHRFALAWWVRAEEPAFLVADLAELAEQLDLAEAQTERAEAAKATLRWLRAARLSWMLIYDNATDPADLGEWLAGGQAGRVLITSRRRGWAGRAHEVPVDAFDPDTATRFLLDESGRDDEVGARALAERLGGLALALGQAAAYLCETGRSFADYLAQLEQGATLLEHPADSAQYQGTVAAVVAQSRAAVLARDPGAGELLDVIAYLDPQRIPLNLLEEREGLPGFSAAALDGAVSALRAYSLIEVGQGGFGVHRLVQEITRAGHQGPAPAEAAISFVEARFPQDSTEPSSWPACAELLSHALALAQHAPEESSPEAMARLLDLAATYVQYRGDARGATPYFEQALEIRRRVLGAEHPHTLASMGNLAATLQALGDLTGARELHERALEAQRRLMGDEHPNTLTSMNNLALTLRDQGDLAGARQLQERVLEAGSRRLFGDEDPDTLISMINLAETLRIQGDLAGARELQERAHETCQRLLGDDHQRTLTSMNNLALTLRAQGDLAGARELQERVLEAARRLIGDEHRDTLISMVNLAKTLRAQGDLSGARELNEHAQEAQRRLLGDEHPHTLFGMSNLAETLRLQGDLAGARELQERALEGYRRMFGDEHPDTLTCMSNLAALLESLSEANEAAG